MSRLALTALIWTALAVSAQAQSKTEVWSEGYAKQAGVDKAFSDAPSGFEHLSGVLYRERKFIVVPPGLDSEKRVALLGLSFGMAVSDRPDNKSGESTDGRCSGDGESVSTAIKLKHYPQLLGDVALGLDCAHERKGDQAWENVQLVSDDDVYLMVVTFDPSDPDAKVYVDLSDWAEANL
jgi:hypothetical protein